MLSIHKWQITNLKEKQNTSNPKIPMTMKKEFNVMNFYEYQSRCASKITIQRKAKNHCKLQECQCLKCNKNTNPKDITTNLKDTNLLQQRKKIRTILKNITNLDVAKLTQTQKKKNKTL